jgi:hypothetical protein
MFRSSSLSRAFGAYTRDEKDADDIPDYDSLDLHYLLNR